MRSAEFAEADYELGLERARQEILADAEIMQLIHQKVERDLQTRP